jgi:SPP1 gp7 family putative phage head morphogenesis protein
MATVNERLLDTSISRAVYVERWKLGLSQRALGFLDREVFPDLTGQIVARMERIQASGRDTGPLTTERLQDVSRLLDEALAPALTTEVRDRMARELTGLAVSEASWEVAQMTRYTAGFGLDFRTPSRAILEAIVSNKAPIGKTIDEHLVGISRVARDEIVSELRVGIAQGDTLQTLVSRVRGTIDARYEDGVFGKVRRSVEAVARTSTNFVVNQAREESMEANSDVVDRVKLVATLDTRTSPVCRARDGEVYPINEGPRPPFHPNCRTMVVPVLKSWAELGIPADETDPIDPSLSARESMNGEVAGDLTYETWLERQPKARQIEILGPARYDLWKREGLSLKDMIDTRGRTLTLEELDEITNN